MEVLSLPFLTLSDAEVTAALRKYKIGLTVAEAREIQKLLGRAPTVTEAVIWGIQGSEHCSYKSSRRFLSQMPTSGKHVVLGPGEDSGIVAITDGPVGKRWCLVASHESHNHPSQLVPFEGAATGVGGTVRDVVCMGARVIGCMDLLRLGDLQTPETRAIAKEVIRGIAGYGNPLGVPNLGGDTVFDSAYNSNCLVNAVALGILREDEIIHSYVPEEAGKVGYDIILVGKPTDRSGFGGAAFASVSMEEDKREQNTGAVQEPNPFLERHLLISTYALFDWIMAEGHLPKVSFKDLGAGGVVCSSVEQVAHRGYGADVQLEKVHVSLPNLPPEVIACAETQERFCWMCHPSLTEHILDHYNRAWDLPSVAEGARASVIGKVNESGVYRLTHNGTVVCEAKSVDITSGLKYTRPTATPDTTHTEPVISVQGKDISVNGAGCTLSDICQQLLQHPNYASRAPVIRRFDKTVIGNSVVEAGEADASVIMPLQDLAAYLPNTKHTAYTTAAEFMHTGIAFAGDGNPRYGRISAYSQGLLATAESICNVAAVGATPRALSDCLNYGNPEIPSQLGALEQGVRGIADAARTLAFENEPVPIITGNVSLYNGLPDGSAIPPSAIVCCMGVLKDARTARGSQITAAGNSLYLLGSRRNECGGSAYYHVLEELLGQPADSCLGANVPTVEAGELLPILQYLTSDASRTQVLSAHDISDGGLFMALFEMTLPCRKRGGAIGLDVDVSACANTLRLDQVLFTQTPGFVVEVSKATEADFLATLAKAGVVPVKLGTTTADAQLSVRFQGKAVLQSPLPRWHDLYQNGLTEHLRRLA